MLSVFAEAQLHGEKQIEINLLVGMWLRAWYLHLRLHRALYRYHWTDPKLIKQLDTLRRDLLCNMDANMHANSRMVRRIHSFFKEMRGKTAPHRWGHPATRVPTFGVALGRETLARVEAMGFFADPNSTREWVVCTPRRRVGVGRVGPALAPL